MCKQQQHRWHNMTVFGILTKAIDSAKGWKQRRAGDRKRDTANGRVNYSPLTFLPPVILVDRFRQAWMVCVCVWSVCVCVSSQEPHDAIWWVFACCVWIVLLQPLWVVFMHEVWCFILYTGVCVHLLVFVCVCVGWWLVSRPSQPLWSSHLCSIGLAANQPLIKMSASTHC